MRFRGGGGGSGEARAQLRRALEEMVDVGLACGQQWTMGSGAVELVCRGERLVLLATCKL